MSKASLFALLFVGWGLHAGPQSADVTVSTEVINEVLFTVAGEARTQRDLELYRAVLSQVFQKKQIGQYSKNPAEDFLLSQLAVREAEAFDLQAEVPRLSAQQKKQFSSYSTPDLEREIRQVAESIALVEIKENQLKQQARFASWVELLRRKYQVRIKSSVYQ